MTASTLPATNPKHLVPVRFDATFIEEHRLLERYLEGKLPPKGARDLENWCRAHPQYLNDLKLPERTQASLKLLEASGQAQDLGEPPSPWWRSAYLLAGLAAVTFLSLLTCLGLSGKYHLLRAELEDTETRLHQGSLVQPAVMSTQYVEPDRTPGVDQASIAVSSTAPQLIDLHIDMGYTKKLMQFKVTVDKQGQGRALILNDVLKDSNGELRATFNTTGISVGTYGVRIEALPMTGPPLPMGWFLLKVN